MKKEWIHPNTTDPSPNQPGK